jgi:hypothetical protein
MGRMVQVGTDGPGHFGNWEKIIFPKIISDHLYHLYHLYQRSRE